MRLATIDPHSPKVHTTLYEIPKFGVNRPNIKLDNSLLKTSKFTRKCMRIRVTRNFFVILIL